MIKNFKETSDDNPEKKLRSVLDKLNTYSIEIGSKISEIEIKIRRITTPCYEDSGEDLEPVPAPRTITEELVGLLECHEYLTKKLDNIYYHLDEYI